MSNRRFQLHLSTLLVLAAAAGGLIYLNLQKGPGYMHVLVDGSGMAPIIGDSISRGWPFACWFGYDYRPGVPAEAQTGQADIFYMELAGNIVVAVLLLASLAFVLEKFVFGRPRGAPAGVEIP